MKNKQHTREPTLHEQILAKRGARGYTKRSLPTSTHNTALPNEATLLIVIDYHINILADKQDRLYYNLQPRIILDAITTTDKVSLHTFDMTFSKRQASNYLTVAKAVLATVNDNTIDVGVDHKSIKPVPILTTPAHKLVRKPSIGIESLISRYL